MVVMWLAAIDLLYAVGVRWVASDTKFSVKVADIGFAAGPWHTCGCAHLHCQRQHIVAFELALL